MVTYSYQSSQMWSFCRCGDISTVWYFRGPNSSQLVECYPITWRLIPGILRGSPNNKARSLVGEVGWNPPYQIYHWSCEPNYQANCVSTGASLIKMDLRQALLWDLLDLSYQVPWCPEHPGLLPMEMPHGLMCLMILENLFVAEPHELRHELWWAWHSEEFFRWFGHYQD